MVVLPDRIPLAAIERARREIADTAVRTPLVRLPHDGPGEIWLKLETLQPVGSFKLRGARNAIGALAADRLAQGIYTASAGNMALGLAWCAKARNIPFTAIVPDHAPAAKQAALERLGARLIRVPFERWWRVLLERSFEGTSGTFIHPVSDEAVMAGNGTIGLEILEDLPEVETILIPFGGGGLTCGIASAVKARGSRARVVACEVATAAPLSAARAAGAPCTVPYTASFVDGIGAAGMLPEMWPLVQRMIDGVAVVSLAETAAAIRLLVERVHVVAEGAGAVPLAAAMAGRGGAGKVCCVISGGNINPERVAKILTDAPGAIS